MTRTLRRRPNPTPAPKPGRQRAAPRLECLESRLVPATFTVTDPSGGSGAGTLVNAVNLANATPGADQIVFDSAVFGSGAGLTDTITFSADNGGNGAALPNVTETLTITGPSGTRLRLERAGGTPDFRFVNLNSGAGTLSLQNLAFVNGSADEAGAVRAYSNLTITGCLFEGNFSAVADGGAVIVGAGTTAVIGETWFKDNAVGAGFAGGAVAVEAGATANFGQCTFSGNAAEAGAALSVRDAFVTLGNITFAENTSGATGGTLAVFGVNSSATVWIMNSTVAYNTTTGTGGAGVYTSEIMTGSVTIYNNSSLFFDNSGDNFTSTGGAPTFTGDSWYNLSDDATGNIGTGVGDQANVADALLGPLHDNGGPVPTVGLLPGSPAINASSYYLSFDARGFERSGDVGAYELRGLVFAGSEGDPQTAFADNDFAVPLSATIYEGDRPVVGWAVRFYHTSGPGVTFSNGLDSIDAVTDATGKAAAGTVTAGPTAGEARVAIDIPGVGSPEWVLTINARPTFVVDRLTDGADDGDLGTGRGSLRWAVAQANALAGADTILIDASLTGTISGPTFELTDDVTIDYEGAAGSLTITAPGSRMFSVASGVTATLRDLRLAGGNANGEPSESGGAIENFGALTVADSIFENNTATYGGAISSSGSLTLTGVTFADNSAALGGGAVFATGTVNVVNSYFRDNDAGDGGAVYVVGTATLSVASSTFANNSADDGGAIAAANGSGSLSVSLSNVTLSGNTAATAGGGLYARTSDFLDLTLSSLTVAGNSASTGGGVAVFGVGGEPTLSASVGRSLFSDNPGGGFVVVGIGVSVNSDGYNLFTDAAVPFTPDGTDQVGVADARLGPLADNGGRVPTRGLLPGSAAIDAAGSLGGFDARGVSRTGFGSAADIGAYELRDLAMTAVSGGGQTAVVTGPFASPLVARLTEGGQPVVGATVDFITSLTPGVSFETPSPVTDADGEVNSGAVTAGNDTGTATVAAVGGASVNFSLTIVAQPSVFVVDRLTDDINDGNLGTGRGSLRWAIAQANAFAGADVIEIDAALVGTIQLASSLPTVSGELVIDYLGTAGDLVVRGGAFRILTNSVTLYVEDVAFADGDASADGFPVGGAILSAGTLTLVRCDFTGNAAALGGAVYSNGSSLTVTDCRFADNTATDGAGVYSANGTLSVRGSLFEDNLGGAVGSVRTDVEVADSYFRDNTNYGGGAGIDFAGNPANPTATYTLLVRGSTFAGGDAVFGGGIRLDGNGMTLDATVVNSTFSGSAASQGGGAIAIDLAGGGDVTLRLLSSTVADNTSGTTGGVYLRSGVGSSLTITTRNSLFADNAGGAFGADAIGAGGVVNSTGGGNNVYTDAAVPDLFASPADVYSAAARLADLADNGGPTPTRRLLPGSDAIGAGVSGAGDPAADQRGTARGSVIDVGAFDTVGYAFTTSGTPQTIPAGGTFDPLAVTVTDGGVPVEGVLVSFSNPQWGSFAATTDAAGTATFAPNGSFTVPATYVVTTFVGDESATFVLTVTPGFFRDFEVSAPATVSAFAPFDLLVRPVDDYGNAILDFDDVVFVGSSDPAATIPDSFDFSANTPANGWFVIPNVVLRTAGTQDVGVFFGGEGASEFATVEVVNYGPSELDVFAPQVVRQGQSFVLTGSFTDGTPNEVRTVDVYWSEDDIRSVTLPPGATTFAIAHAFRGDPGTYPVYVVVRDQGGGSAGRMISVEVENDPPTLQVGDDVDRFTNVNTEFVRFGRVIDDGELDTFTVTVDFGDGTGARQVQVNPDRTFVLRHVYREEASFVVTVTVLDNHGDGEIAEFDVDVLLPGVPTNTAVRTEVPSGGSGTATSGGVSATLYTQADGRTDKAIIVAVVPVFVAAQVNDDYASSRGLVISASYDVRAVNVGPGDFAIVTFAFASGDGRPPVLTYLRRDGTQAEVKSSLYAYDAARQTLTLRFDRTSTPQLMDMSGTVFTISVATLLPGPPAPSGGGGGGPGGPPVLTASAVTQLAPPSGQALFGPAGGPAAEAAALSAAAAQSALTALLAVKFEADGVGFGGRTASAGEAEAKSALEAVFALILRSLPPAAEGVTVLEALPLTTGNAEPVVPETAAVPSAAVETPADVPAAGATGGVVPEAVAPEALDPADAVFAEPGAFTPEARSSADAVEPLALVPLFWLSLPVTTPPRRKASRFASTTPEG